MRLKARLSLKSRNLNLKYACGQCKSAKERKRARLDREEDERDVVHATEDGENNNSTRTDGEDSSNITDDDVDVTETTGKKRKRSGEKHTHCHCPLYDVTDSLVDYMASGQPYRRFKADQVKKGEAAKVDKVITLQRQKLDKTKYAMDIKKEILRFKHALKLTLKDRLPRTEIQVDSDSFLFSFT